MIKGFKFLKKYYRTIQADHSKSDLNLILTMVDELDKNCDRKILNKFKNHPYSKTFFKQKNLKEVVMEKRYKKGTLGSELKIFWKNNKDDLFHKNFNLSKTKGKKRIAFLQGVLNEHDLVHCLNRLDSTPIAELSVLAFTIAKGFRWSFFYICMASLLLSIRNSFGKTAIQGPFWYKIKFNPAISIFRLILEGYIKGKQTPWFMTVNWHELLDKPIDEVRHSLNIKKFTVWEEIKPEWYKLLKSYKTIK
jgi:ubiquinone biosynthesis protein Coq4